LGFRNASLTIINNDLDESSFEINLLVPVSVIPPTNLITSIDEGDSTRIVCSWEDNTDDETAYELQWAVNSSNDADFIRIALLDKNITSYSFGPEFPILTNVFRVRAIGPAPDSIPSPWSNLNIGIPYPFTVGLEDELEAKRLKVFPNPTANIITLETKEIGEMKVYLFNMQGKQLFSTKFEKNIEINLKNYPSGVYLLRYEINNIKGFRKILRK